jgi:hypothetical protein
LVSLRHEVRRKGGFQSPEGGAPAEGTLKNSVFPLTKSSQSLILIMIMIIIIYRR